ncbi:MAG: AAA family ATPase [Gammaproteobacteria bacterium]|nr:AAA family ATPase [Gammaproteobacteria bacterium]
MHLHRMTLRNFAGVRGQTVEFAPNVTVVAGPNEVGKTSFQAALRLLFQYPDNSNATPIRRIVPAGQDNTGPEVELAAEVGPYEFVYRKRWRYLPMTELVVRTPAPANLVGRDAHNRARAILEEASDFALFEALQLMQGAPLAQADLEAGPSLSQALDKAAGGGDPAAENDSFYQAVTQVYTQYWTLKTGRETGELAAAREAATEAETALLGFQGQLAELAGYAEAVTSGERDLERQEQIIHGQRKRLEEQEAKSEAIAALEKAVAELRTSEAKAALVLAQASTAHCERERHRQDETEAKAQVERLEEQLALARRQLTALQKTADTQKEAADGARQAYASAARERASAESIVSYLSARTAHASLQHKLGQIEDLMSKRSLAEAEIQRLLVDDAGLQALQDAHHAWRVASSLLEAQAPSIRLHARRPVTLTTEAAAPRNLAAGEAWEQPVTGALVLDVPEVLTLQVAPGATLADRQDECRAAADELARLCGTLGVKDLSEAQDQHRRRRALSQAVASADAEIRLLEDGRQLSDLRKAQARHAAALRETETLNLSMPDSLDAAEAALGTARDTAQTTESRREELSAELELAEHAARQAAQEEQDLSTRLSLASDAFSRAGELLRRQRAQSADEELANHLQEATAAHAEAQKAVEGGRSKLAASSPDTARLELQSARDALERAKSDRDGLRDELNRARGRLASLRDRGLQEKRDAAQAKYQHAQRQFESTARRANAVRRLHRTLSAHRDAAKRKYLAPFQQRVEGLVRLVQGADVRLTLNDDLSVQARTIGDTTIPFESLSGGAREQIGLACRLAAAMLVADGGGVPVLLDDTLGYSDPDRLPKLGAMIDHAGRHVQIVIFTCQPTRFADVGAAITVHLDRQPAGAVSSTDSPGEPLPAQ